MRGYVSRVRDFSFFGLLLAFGLLFWADFEIVLCHVNGMGWVCSQFKGLFLERIWLKNYIYRSFQNAPATLGHAITWIGAIVWLLVYSNFG